MTPAELFTQAGRALFGEEFTAPLANALGVERNTVGKWASGKTRIPPGVWGDVHVQLAARQIDLARIMPEVAGHIPWDGDKPPPVPETISINGRTYVRRAP